MVQFLPVAAAASTAESDTEDAPAASSETTELADDGATADDPVKIIDPTALLYLERTTHCRQHGRVRSSRR